MAQYILAAQFHNNQNWVGVVKILLKCRDDCHRLALQASCEPRTKELVVDIFDILGEAYVRQCVFELALPIFEDALVFAQQIPGNDNTSSEKITHKIKAAKMAILKQGGDVALIQKNIQRCTIGDDAQVAVLYGDLCGTYMNRGDLELAMNAGSKSLATARQVGNQELVGDMSFRIASILYRLGKPDEALPYIEEALPILRATHGNKSVAVAEAIFQLGLIRESLGEIDSVIKLYEKGLRTLRRAAGDQHANVEIFMKKLWSTYMRHEEYAKALKLMKKEEKIMRSILPNYESMCSNLANVCSENA